MDVLRGLFGGNLKAVIAWAYLIDLDIFLTEALPRSGWSWYGNTETAFILGVVISISLILSGAVSGLFIWRRESSKPNISGKRLMG